MRIIITMVMTMAAMSSIRSTKAVDRRPAASRCEYR
jgi:hypothetical protein